MGQLRAILAKLVLIGIATAGCIQQVRAETIEVAGTYAATHDLPGNVEVIAIEPFGGNAGSDVLRALKDQLDAAVIDGEPWFRIIAASSGLPPDAVLRGSVRSDVVESRIESRVMPDCAERDGAGLCMEREDVAVPCWERTTLIEPRILLLDAQGRQLYAVNQQVRRESRFCRNDLDIPSAPDEIKVMVNALATMIRTDLAPVEKIDAVRVMESRKGLERSDRKAFREAVKLTNSDPPAACAAWRALEARNYEQVSLLYNIGLCHEAEGMLEVATEYYVRALAASPERDYPAQGMERIGQRLRGEAQIAARAAASAP